MEVLRSRRFPPRVFEFFKKWYKFNQFRDKYREEENSDTFLNLNINGMKRILFLLAILGLIIAYACKDDNDTGSERLRLLTGPVWNSDSLLANGVEAGGEGGILEKFCRRDQIQ